MQRVLAAVAGLCLAGLAGCSAPVEPPPLRARPQITAEPLLEGRLGRAPRLRLSSASADVVSAGELSLWEGELSDSQLARLRRGDVPSTLTERAIPALAWPEPNGVCLRPSTLLEEGARVTLLSVSLGKLGEWEVAGGRALDRRFPAPDAAGAGFAVLCGEETPSGAWSFPLEPGQVPAELEPDFGSYDEEPCVAVRWDASEPGPLLLPPEIEGFALDPTPYAALAHEPSPPGDCTAEELSLGPLCAAVEDDRLVLTTGNDGLLLRALLPSGVELVPAFVGAVLRGFAPDAEQSLVGSVITAVGDELAFAVEFHTGAARARWVLNEVLANPLGAEPAQEWVELVNASAAPASLLGLSLSDAGGQVLLPDVAVEPGEQVVLVSEAFSDSLQGQGQDVPFEPSVRLVRLPQLGKSGLSNSGEPLELRSADGGVLSRFPALPSKHAGVSLARRRLDSPDDDVTEFGEHADPGASPGAPNRLR
jgi:hypothetical protein